MSDQGGKKKRRKAKKVRPFKVAGTRAFSHDLDIGGKKQAAIRALMKEYRATAKLLIDFQLTRFFTGETISQDCPLPLKTKLSQRYLRCCNYQVVSMLKSWWSNRKNDFLRTVKLSSMPQNVKDSLIAIGGAQAWYRKDVKQPRELMRLAQNILRGLLNRHRFPNARRINLLLNKNVAVFEDTNHATAFPAWIKLSTLETGKPIYLPVTPHEHFKRAVGVRCEALQLNQTETGSIRLTLMKDIPKEPYTPASDLLALDFGLAFMFATNHGDLCGTDFQRRLRWYDQRMSSLAAGRQKAGLPVRCPKYDKLVGRLRGYLRNEVGRIINHLVDRYRPREIVVEKLNFQGAGLSRRMNRLLSNCGRAIIQAKLNDVNERFGIKITEIYAAYTSQECPNCHHTDKSNRPTRDTFQCVVCGTKTHADINGARNAVARRSGHHLGNQASEHFRYGKGLLSELRNAHLQWRAHHARVRGEQGRRSAPCNTRTTGPNVPGDSGLVRQSSPAGLL